MSNETQSTATITLGPVQNSAFVVMPFHSHYEVEYQRVIKPAVEAAGLACARGDEIYARAEIIQDVWRAIREARVIVAELSGRNPNVMYEVGLAHAIGKPIILLTRNEEDVPFDLRALRYVYYDQNNPYWGPDLRETLTSTILQILEQKSITPHLAEIQVEGLFPKAPNDSGDHKISSGEVLPIPRLDGIWIGRWLSVRNNRPHDITLTIPD